VNGDLVASSVSENEKLLLVWNSLLHAAASSVIAVAHLLCHDRSYLRFNGRQVQKMRFRMSAGACAQRQGRGRVLDRLLATMNGVTAVTRYFSSLRWAMVEALPGLFRAMTLCVSGLKGSRTCFGHLPPCPYVHPGQDASLGRIGITHVVLHWPCHTDT
jgi:hypothetical protein